MMILLLARDLAYEYQTGDLALRGVDFSLDSGDSLALIGANGAGKSTLLSLVVGILTPTGGEIFFDGKPVTKSTVAGVREKIGFVFQNAEHQLFCNTVLDDVMFAPLNAGMARDSALAASKSALSELQIKHLENRAPYRLSAGEKRLAAIASVLSMKPQILLMDEPSAELDPRARRELIALLNHLPQAKIIATHDLDLAMKTCADTMILHNGRIAATGKSAELLADDELLRRFGL